MLLNPMEKLVVHIYVALSNRDSNLQKLLQIRLGFSSKSDNINMDSRSRRRVLTSQTVRDLYLDCSR